MGRAVNGDTEIHYETMGAEGDPVFLLVNGFTSQLIRLPDAFCQMLVDQGFRVVRYDNRDVGLSSKTPGADVPSLAAVLRALSEGRRPDIPYDLADMAADAVAVLDDLDVAGAHVAGMSMGGMIAQVMAIEDPGRVLSLTSIMSTTGDRSVGGSTPEALAALQAPPPAERDSFVANAVDTGRVVSGPLFDPQAAADLAAASYDRCFHPPGATCQMAAIMAATDRTEALREIDVPALVVHGRVDPLIALDGGEATAAAIDGARLVVFDEMGHDWPEALWPAYVDLLAQVASRPGRAA